MHSDGVDLECGPARIRGLQAMFRDLRFRRVGEPRRRYERERATLSVGRAAGEFADSRRASARRRTRAPGRGSGRRYHRAFYTGAECPPKRACGVLQMREAGQVHYVVVKRWRFDGWRIAISTAVTAGLAVGSAAALLYHSSHTPHVGPTAASLSDAFSWAAGACLGLAIGSFATAMFVRRGSRLGSGVVVGVLAFLVGVVPYSWLTASSDVSNSDNLGWLVIVFIPAVMLVSFGAAVGEFFQRASARRRRHGRG